MSSIGNGAPEAVLVGLKYKTGQPQILEKIMLNCQVAVENAGWSMIASSCSS